MTRLIATLAAYESPVDGPLWGAWEREVAADLDSITPSDHETVANELHRDASWTLLGWVERAATQIVRSRDPDLLDLAVAALSVLNDADIDRRDVFVVAQVLRRASELVEIEPAAVADRVARRTARSANASVRAFVTGPPGLPPTHEEHGTGDEVEIRRSPSTVDTDRILAWWSSQEPDT